MQKKLAVETGYEATYILHIIASCYPLGVWKGYFGVSLRNTVAKCLLSIWF